jgi:hypothetical protein
MPCKCGHAYLNATPYKGADYDAGWQACNARWEQKLGEEKLTLVLHKAQLGGGRTLSVKDSETLAKAIIEHMKGE